MWICRAWLLVPNALLFSSFGKFLFVFADMCIAGLLLSLLSARGCSQAAAASYTAAFLLHPFAINVSTRGNADSIVCFLVLYMLHMLFERRVDAAAILFGVAVHMKIYPIIYGIPMLLFMNEDYCGEDFIGDGSSSRPGGQLSQTLGKPLAYTVHAIMAGVQAAFDAAHGVGVPGAAVVSVWISKFRSFVTIRRAGFGLLSVMVFGAITALCYLVYGWTFLYETYLYHLTRTDNRHNFSPYFYDLYLRWEPPSNAVVPAGTLDVAKDAASMSSRTLAGLLSFLPQMGTALALGSIFHKDLAFALFLQTWVFVAWNKVITVQYFHWYLALLPLALAQSRLSLKGQKWKLAALGILWLVTELHWNFWAYWLELRGQSSFLYVWMAGLVFFAANVCVLAAFITHHNYTPAFSHGNLVPYKWKDA
jgi:phosphatidylinositol glycan class M